jgi:hypothetical protein
MEEMEEMTIWVGINNIHMSGFFELITGVHALQLGCEEEGGRGV